MKRILLIVSIFMISFYSEAQKYQDALLYGENKNRLDVFYLLGIPNDTFAIPSFPQDKRRKPHIAAKGNTMYLWDTTAYRWNPITAGVGGSGDGIASLGNSGNLWLLRPNDSTYAVDTATANTFYRTLFPQLSGSYANPSWISSLAWSKITGTPTTLSGYGITDAVPSSRTITINGTTYDLSANRSWTVSGGGQPVKFDSSYTPLGGNRGSEYIVKSIRIRRNSSTVTPTQIGDSAMYWDISVPTTYIDSMRRVGLNVQAYKNGAWATVFTDSVGSGGGGSPAGNYGNVQLNRNGSFATPGSDSLNFSGGLSIKGTLSATALPTGGVAADSLVVVTSAGALKKRNAAVYPSGSGTDLQVALWNGTNSLTGHQRYTWANSNDYPTLTIGDGSGATYGAAIRLRSIVGDYAYISSDGNQLAFYGLPGTKSLSFYSYLGGPRLLGLSKGNTGGAAVFNKTVITVDTAVGGPSIGSIHAEYNAGDSTSAGTDVGRHMFRGIGRTYANAGSFNTFYSTVEAGNTTYTQDHIINWQSDAKKTGANTLNIIYHLGILGDSIKAGTVNNRWGVYMYDAKVTAGATLAHQSALRVPKLASAVRNYDMFSDSAQTVKMDGNLLIGDSSLATGARKTIHLFNGTAPSSNISGSILYSESGEFKIRNGSGAINTLSGNAVFSGTIKTADPGSGAGAWKFGQFHSASGLILDSAGYIEVNIGGTVYWLALAATPFPKPNPKP